MSITIPLTPFTLPTILWPETNINSFGAVHDGVTDDTPALLAAQNFLGSRGGAIVLGPNKYLFDTGFTVNPGVVIVGQNYKPSEQDAVFGDAFGETSTVIYLNPSQTYSWSDKSGLLNCSVLKTGMTAPSTTAQATALVASFAGQAITIAGDDIIMQNLFIGGFDQALAWDDVANDHVRPLFSNIFFDCNNGLKIGNVGDAGLIDHIKAFPTLTGHDELLPGFPTPADGARVLHTRSGTGMAFFNDQGGGTVRDCNIFGWNAGWKFTDVGGLTLVACSVDADAYGVLPMTRSGFWFLGFCQVRLIDPWTAGQAIAFKLETSTVGSFVNAIGGYSFQNATHVKITSTQGDFSFLDHRFGNVANAHGDATTPIWQATAVGQTTFANNTFYDPGLTYPGAHVFQVDAGLLTQFNNNFNSCSSNHASIIATGNLTGTAVAITNIPAGFAYLMLEIIGASSGSTEQTEVQFSTNAGSSYDTTAANYPGYFRTGATITAKTLASALESATHTAAQSDSSTLKISGYDLGPSKITHARISANAVEYTCDGAYLTNNAINALRILGSAGGTFDAGSYTLYGIA